MNREREKEREKGEQNEADKLTEKAKGKKGKCRRK